MIKNLYVKYAVRKLLFLIPTFIGASIAIFFIMSAIGSPVYMMMRLSPLITPEIIQNLERYYQLDKPVWYRYLVWMGKFLVGDMGNSFYSGESVSFLIGQLAWETLKLQFASIALAAVLGIPVGIYTALKQYSKTDFTVTIISVIGYSMPIFWFGLLMIIAFAYYLPWFPSFGAHSLSPSSYPYGSYILDEIWHLFLPAIVLGYSYLASFVRLTRSSMLEVMRQDYILAAKASGLRLRKIVYKYALKNAMLPVITYLGVYFALSIAGAPITETVFSWPGLGYTLVQSVLHLDYPLIMGITMVICIFVIVVNLIMDIVYSLFDPRITL